MICVCRRQRTWHTAAPPLRGRGLLHHRTSPHTAKLLSPIFPQTATKECGCCLVGNFWGSGGWPRLCFKPTPTIPRSVTSLFVAKGQQAPNISNFCSTGTHPNTQEPRLSLPSPSRRACPAISLPPPARKHSDFKDIHGAPTPRAMQKRP